ncbi:MAG TPA: AAA family ATPase, partial [Mycobacterium sp.]
MRGGWPLTGRAEELRLIDAALDGSADTAGVAIAGPAGVGKSRLAREALAVAASHGYAARWAAGTTSARGVPLGALAEWAAGQGADPLQLVRGIIGALTEGIPATRV